MKSLTTRAADLSARRELRPVPLVVLTTYTDRGAASPDTIYYFSDRVVLYDYANTGNEREFGAFLLGIDPLVQSMDHLPDVANGSLERTLTLHLANISVDGGSRLYEVLEGKRLLFATVEVAQILMDPGKRETLADVRALTGAEHQVWYRGEVVAHSADEERITLVCQATQRSIPWIVANAPSTNDPLDVGRRLPIVYGSRPKVPAVGYTVGWETTLAEAITASQTGNVEVTDGSGFSGSGITVRIGNEEVTVTAVDAGTINITARAQNSTTATLHGRGEKLIEMVSTIVYVVAGHAVKAINDVYLQNPATGDLVRVPSGFTKTISDTTTISGKTIASVSFTAAQLRTVLNDLFPDVDFTAGNETFNVTPAGREIVTGTFDFQTIATPGSAPLFTGTAGAGTERWLRCWFPVDSLPDNTREVVRARLRASGNVKSTVAARAIQLVVGQDDLPGFETGDEAFISASNTELFGQLGLSGWETPAGGTTLADFETNSPSGASEPIIMCHIRNAGTPEPKADEYGELTGDWGIQFEVLPNLSGSFIGALVGFGLRLFADLEGPVAHDSLYSVANDTLLEHPSDVIRHFIGVLCGYGTSAPDDSTFDALVTALGSGAKMAPILNELGEDFATVAQRLAFEARANLVQEESASATVFKVYAASTTWTWGSSERTLDLYERLSSESRDGSQVATRFRALYAPDLSKRTDEEIWAKALRADPEASDLAGLTAANLVDSEEDFGRRDHEGFAFPSIYLDATAIDLATYYGKELSRDARVIRVEGLPWWLAYDLERGTIVSITPRWSAAAFKCRVVSYTKDFANEKVNATLVEVA